jgi:hypothetical protein
MPMKEQQRMVYRTARGKEVDVGKLINQNELVPAVGNAKVNARGDKLGEGGKIIRRREEMTPQPVNIPNQINVREVAAPVAQTPAPLPNTPTRSKKDISTHDPEGNE